MAAGFGGVVRRRRWLLAVPVVVAAGGSVGALWRHEASDVAALWRAGAVIGIGLGTGLLLAAIREGFDPTLHSEEQAETALELPVLAAVPSMPSLAERRRRRIRGAAAVAAALAAAGTAAVAAYTWIG